MTFGGWRARFENVRGGATEFERGFCGDRLDVRDAANAVSSEKFAFVGGGAHREITTPACRVVSTCLLRDLLDLNNDIGRIDGNDLHTTRMTDGIRFDGGLDVAGFFLVGKVNDREELVAGRES